MEQNHKDYHLQPEESRFLSGPLSRMNELLFTIKVMFSFIQGFRKMHFIWE